MDIKDEVIGLPPYQRPYLLFNNHIETIYPAVWRSVHGVEYMRERISTPDDDFLDLDWLQQQATHLIILSHGLEGNTQRAYMKGMAKAFYEMGYDVLAWNYRGCSEEMNRQLRFYHSGATDDLDTVVNHAMKKSNYQYLSLIGFSLGGNLTLKYLGEKGDSLDSKIHKSVVFSVPLDLHASCQTISRHWIYTQRFVRGLKQKVINKSKQNPALKIDEIHKIKTLIDFDDAYTAPIHHFKNAIDYYQKCSSIHFVENICIPTLIINALNDPFLDQATYQSQVWQKNKWLHFETPSSGGHVGFALFNQNGLYWSELKALDFINK